jgi:hypothetical protein
VLSKTPPQGAVQLERLHATFRRINASGVIFVAALKRFAPLNSPNTLAADPRGRSPRPSGRSTSGARCRSRTDLHVESTEFLTVLPCTDAQDLMHGYRAGIDATGELPLYDPRTYQQALAEDSVPGRRRATGR